MKILVKKINNDAIIPSFDYIDDTGFSLYTCEDITIKCNQTVAVPTGLAFEFPVGYAFQVKPRSGNSLKGVLCTNGKYEPIRIIEGTIDNGYRGNVSVIVKNEAGHKITIPKGTKIAQGVIIKYYQFEFVETDELGESERNGNGFGSTDK